MKFCPRCKSMLVPTKSQLSCVCGHKENSRIKFNEKIKNEVIEVVVENNDPTGNIEVPIICWNCGHKGVYFWMHQMRRSDEPPTRFYRCKKCKKTWRSGK